MPYGEYAQCPCCGKTAFGKDEIEEDFGYRNMGMVVTFHSRIVASVVPHIAKQVNLVKLMILKESNYD